MEMNGKWSKPIYLEDGAKENLIYKLDLDAIPNAPGVYVFVRIFNNKPLPISSVPTFFRVGRPEKGFATVVNGSRQVQAIDLLALFRTWSNSGFVGFHIGYATA